MNQINIGNICRTQWTSIFQVINARWHKIHTRVKHSFKVWDSSMDFSWTGFKKFIDISGSILSLSFKKLSLAKLGAVSEENIHIYLQRPLNSASPLLRLFKLYLSEAELFFQAPAKPAYHTRLNPEAYMRIQRSFLSQTLKEFAKIQNNPSLFTKLFDFGKCIYIFFIKVWLVFIWNGFIIIQMNL